MKQTLEHDAPKLDPIKVLQWALPAVIVLIFAGWLSADLYKATADQGMSRFDYDALGQVPVSEDGRVKPFDTVARNALLVISSKQKLSGEMLLEGEGESRPAVVWLAELMANRPEAMDRKVIRIDDPDVLALIGKTLDDGKYYSFREFAQPRGDQQVPFYIEIGKMAEAAAEVRDDKRDRFQEHVIGLRQKLGLILELRAMARPYVVPPVEPGQDWAPIVEPTQAGMLQVAPERAPHDSWLELMQAFRDQDGPLFNARVESHLAMVSEHVPEESKKASFEQGYNRYEPFIKGIALYIAAGLLCLLAMLLRPILPAGWFVSLWRAGLGLIVLTFMLHTAALIIRIWLQGRPPVTNLYSSAVFIGWGVVGGAIVLEYFTRLGVAALAASCGGVATLIVAHQLSLDGDTMGVMQAVLDSNFWLGTHVITITLGYAATFLAGFIALLYIFFGMLTPIVDRKMARAMAGMVYATICFALIFSFVGTVLGGIWADQSWGRFWGWDPKENGAILIVLMNAIILHARWGHLVKERGIMVLAVGGNIITAWSWFGTNMLGVGLHAYGFMDKAYYVLAAFVASQLLIMSIAMIVPTNYWMSFRRPSKKQSPSKGLKGPKPQAAPGA